MSWAGHEDMGWFEIGPEPEPVVDKAAEMKKTIEGMLRDTEQYVAIDNTSVTKGERVAWMEYRRQLKEVYLQPDYPNIIFWPTRPE